MAKEIIIHPGMPKTGTTTLQNRIFKNHDEYLYLGKHNNGSQYTFGEKDRDEWILSLKRDLVTRDLSYFEDFDLEQVLQDEFGEAYERHNKLFLSEEDILARCITPGKYGDLVQIGSAYDIFTKLKVLFEHSSFTSMKIILTLRKQDDLIESFFAEEYYNFRTFWGIKNPVEYVEHLFDNGQHSETEALFRYNCLVKHLDSLFGKENVLVLPYEKLKTDPGKFLGDISDFMGIKNWENSHQLREQKDNTRDADKKPGKVAKVRPMRYKLSQLKRKLLGDVATGLGEYLKFIDKFQRETVIKLDEHHKDKVLDNYQEENQMLRNRVKYISECSYY